MAAVDREQQLAAKSRLIMGLREGRRWHEAVGAANLRQGVLDPRWSAWFAGLHVASDAAGEATLTGPLPDQVAPTACSPGFVTSACR